MPTKTAGFSRPPLERMMRLHAELKAGAFPNCQQIAIDLEVSPKTVQRDIDFMRDRLGLPIEYHARKFGFHYTEEVTHFPSIEVSEGEITALFVAQKALAQYKGTPFERPLRSAFRKITDGLRDRIAFSWTEMDDAISFRSAGASTGDLEVFEALSKAVLRSLGIEFDYRKLRSRGYEPRQVHPYHLSSVENQWYLFGHDLQRGKLRTFALPRIRRVKLTEKKFQRPTNFSVAKVLQESFGVFSGREKFHIKLRFDEFAARIVAERIWHKSQKLQHARNGSLILEMDLGGLEEIERWILSWGRHVRVLAPKELAARIRDEAKTIAKNYA